MNILDTYRPMNIWVMPPSHNLSENKGAIPFYNKANMKEWTDTELKEKGSVRIKLRKL